MPTEGFDGIGPLFYKADDGDYVSLNDIRDLREIENKTNCKPSMTTEEVEQSLEELRARLREMQEKAEEQQPYDTMLISDEFFMQMMLNHALREEGKEFFYQGTLVLSSPNIPMGTVYLTTREYAYDILRMFDPTVTTAYAGVQKEEPKPYHCRICGRRYFDKADAKECVRSHEWQNRKGRR